MQLPQPETAPLTESRYGATEHVSLLQLLLGF